MVDTEGRVLVVDDEASARDALAELLADEGYWVEAASNGRKALGILCSFDPDVVLTDLKMPDVDGIQLISQGRQRAPHATFVVMTAFGTIDTAVEAIKKGAENYLTKPLEMGEVSAIVARALDRARLARETGSLRERLYRRASFPDILGNHPSMQRLLKKVAQVAPTRATVVIYGESGTGKELIARAIHRNSERAKGPLVAVNCAALAQTLLESELFGHERGAFTGATSRRLGRFEQADGGTVLLDEVSEIPLAAQMKLLRFLQEREFERVGGNETLEVDVRVVAATNRDLGRLVREGRFRQDLYYRLNVVQLEVPPLRARRSDIPTLAHHFLRKHAEENERRIQGFTEPALRRLTMAAWPGNVRELENAVERAVALCPDDTIDVEHLPETTEPGVGEGGEIFAPGMTMEELERRAIEQTLDAVDGSTAKAAELLGISRRKIQYRIKEWGLRGAHEGEGDSMSDF